MQLSVGRYKAIAVGRGATLDTIDVPLNNRVWLESQFAAMRKLDREEDRLRAIEAILGTDRPGTRRLLRRPRQPSAAAAPGPRTGLRGGPRLPALGSASASASRPGWPLAWCQNAQTLYDAPLLMHYDGLDPRARYRVRVVYAGDNFRRDRDPPRRR